MRMIHLLLGLLIPSTWYRAMLACKIEECKEGVKISLMFGDVQRASMWADRANEAQRELDLYDLSRIKEKRLKGRTKDASWENVTLL